MGPPSYGRSLSSLPYTRPCSGEGRDRKGRHAAGSLQGCRSDALGQGQGQAQGWGQSQMLPQFTDLTNTFEVEIKRNSLGLGFSISGGPDASPPWTNLIRVKKVFPLQPAWETGQLRVGDVILRVCSMPLTGLHLRQALDILRTSPPLTVLLVTRISESRGASWPSLQLPRSRTNIVRSYSYGQQLSPGPNQYSPGPNPFSPSPGQESNNPGSLSLGPVSTQQSQAPTRLRAGQVQAPLLSLSACQPIGDSMDVWDAEAGSGSPVEPFDCGGSGGGSNSCTSSREWSPDCDSTMSLLQPVEAALRNSSQLQTGQFTVSLTKVSGSLGFTLRQLDDTVLKHTIKALVKEPALSDGRIKPGDKLLSANNVELASFSHQEVIQFLRQCPDTVSLELYRDASRSQTPLSPEQSLFDSLVCRTLPQEAKKGLLPGTSHSRTSQSPSRKHLRYEAAELVRSLQSSRTSLEKAGLGGSSNPGSYNSSGTLGRRLGRPYSPALKERKELVVHSQSSPQPNTLESPHTYNQPTLGSPQAYNQPTVESPLSPANTSAPASLSQGVTRAFQGMHLQEEERLFIEEVDSGGTGSPASPQVTEVLSVPNSPPSGLTHSLPLSRNTSDHFLIGQDVCFCIDF